MSDAVQGMIDGSALLAKRRINKDKWQWFTFTESSPECGYRFATEADALVDAAERLVDEGETVFVAKIVKVVRPSEPIVEDF